MLSKEGGINELNMKGLGLLKGTAAGSSLATSKKGDLVWFHYIKYHST